MEIVAALWQAGRMLMNTVCEPTFNIFCALTTTILKKIRGHSGSLRSTQQIAQYQEIMIIISCRYSVMYHAGMRVREF